MKTSLQEKSPENYFVNLYKWAEENGLLLLVNYIANTENMYRRLGLNENSFSYDKVNKKLKIIFTPIKNIHNGLHLDLENGEEIDLAHGGILAHFIDSCAGALLFTQLGNTKLSSTCENYIQYNFPVLLNNQVEIVAYFPIEQDPNDKKVIIKVDVFQNIKGERRLCCEARLIMRGVKPEVLAKILSK
jgi:acyl-coenzyme A thioesterase PaaI-like protein